MAYYTHTVHHLCVYNEKCMRNFLKAAAKSAFLYTKKKTGTKKHPQADDVWRKTVEAD